MRPRYGRSWTGACLDRTRIVWCRPSSASRGDVPDLAGVDVPLGSTEISANSSWPADTSVNTYTLVGDSIVDGRALTGIRISGVTKSRGASNLGGLSIVQTLVGSYTGFLLWNPQRNAVHSIESKSDYNGTFSMPMGEFPTAGWATSRLSVRG